MELQLLLEEQEANMVCVADCVCMLAAVDPKGRGFGGGVTPFIS